MLVSRKTRYALRATFELARHFGMGPVKIARIAKAQAIPLRFLETILNHLKRGGFVYADDCVLATTGVAASSLPGEASGGDTCSFSRLTR